MKKDETTPVQINDMHGVIYTVAHNKIEKSTVASTIELAEDTLTIDRGNNTFGRSRKDIPELSNSDLAQDLYQLAHVLYPESDTSMLVPIMEISMRHGHFNTAPWGDLLAEHAKGISAKPIVMMANTARILALETPFVIDSAKWEPTKKGLVLVIGPCTMVWIFPPLAYNKLEKDRASTPYYLSQPSRHSYYGNEPYFMGKPAETLYPKVAPLLAIFANCAMQQETAIFEEVMLAINKGEATFKKYGALLDQYYQTYIKNVTVDNAHQLYTAAISPNLLALQQTSRTIGTDAQFWENRLFWYKWKLLAWKFSVIGSLIALLACFIYFCIVKDASLRNSLSEFGKIPGTLQTFAGMLLSYLALHCYLEIRYLRKMVDLAYTMKTKLRIWEYSFDLAPDKQIHFIGTYKDMLSKNDSNDGKDELAVAVLNKIK